MSFPLRNPAVVLAALMQVLPIVRTFVSNPATASTFAFVLRWTLGTTAAVGAFDSVSGATSVFTSPNTFSGSVGNYFSNNVVVSIGGGNTAASSDYCIVSGGGASSPPLSNGQTSTVAMPPGLTFKSSWVNNAKTIGGVIYGTPTTTGTFPFSATIVSPGNASLSQAITVTISGSSGPIGPTITSPPVATSVTAGNNATFTVTASGTAPLGYFWLKNGNPLANAGNISGANTATLTIGSTSAADAANYSVIVSNSVSTVTSAAVALSVVVPPAITSQPAPQTAAVGATSTFSVTATGSAPLAYRWLLNNTTIANGTKYAGVTTSVLTVNTVTTVDAGNYSVIITNLAGSVTSSVAPLTVVSSPTITTPPANLSVTAGANAAFTVVAAGSAPLAYQWLKNNSPLANGGNVSGAATATLNLSAVTSGDVASYSVAVSNSLGGVISPAATLTVAIPPAIVTSPADATVTAGSNVSFTVTASGTAPLSYQWFKDNVKISGATSATLTLANVSATDAASYFATVTNTVGNATSAAATLTVLGPPTITTQPVSATVVQGNPASFTVGVSGTAPLNLQWLLNGGAIPGATATTLTFAYVSPTDAGNYSVVVTNIVGGVASFGATLTVLVPPTILTQPADVTATAGNSASFSVTASGTAPLTYQWLKNGGNLSGATSATLTLANVSTTNAGNYSVVVANAAGTATSGSAVLTVPAAPAIVTQPASQVGAFSSPISLSVVATSSAALNYQWFKSSAPLADDANISGSTSNILTIAALTTNEVATYFVVVSNSLGSVTSSDAIISVNVNTSPVITMSPVSQTVAANSLVTLTVTATSSNPLTYQWLKNGAKLANSATISGATSASLTLANLQVNSGGSYSVLVTNSYGRATSATATLTVLAAPVVTTPANRSAKPGATTIFAVTAKGGAPLSYQWFKNDVVLTDGGNVSGSATSSLKISALTTNDAAVYFVTVTNLVGGATSGNATLTLLGSIARPVILAPPTNQAAVVSHDVEFSVQVNGTAPMSFQWRKGNKVIPGATNVTLRLINVKTNDAATYSVIVKNPVGKATSKPAKLTVWIPPLFTQQPTSRTSTNGMTTIFKTVVLGSKPISYQWFKNGVALTNGSGISGAQTTVLTVAALHWSDAGVYTLRLTNMAGTNTSSNAVLTVKFVTWPGSNDQFTVTPALPQAGVTATPSLPNLQITSNPGGSITLWVTGGQPDTNYVLEATEVLASPTAWSDIGTNRAAGDGSCQLSDPHAGEHTARFYRARAQ